MKNLLFIILSLALLEVSAQTDSTIEVLKAKSMINILKKSFDDNNDIKDVVTKKLDSLISVSTSKEAILIYNNAKIDIGKGLVKLKKSKDVSTLTKSELKGFTIENDKFNNIIFIKPYQNLFGNRFGSYIVIKDGLLSMRFYAEYRSSDWIFFNRIIVLTGDKKYEYQDTETRRDVTGGVEEVSDVTVDDYLMSMLIDISKYKKAEVRFQGKDYYADREMSKREVQNITNILQIYNKLIVN